MALDEESAFEAGRVAAAEEILELIVDARAGGSINAYGIELLVRDYRKDLPPLS